ncbi:hypothetical protein [Marinomonas pollencensis]|uniref:Uncharacterized protein n=1 Tax=Marinomonas pollencensis TaxID=491954 RepID=A0A3E0DK01_9GAMM|nr:hypothetical protein [Marinomonas pollencensis]REG83016.1 hypothetical protein DFP81_107196 [Marinomonas pollencensis]
MNDNLIPFPNIKRVSSAPSERATSNSELIELRAAFDRARAEWPIEIAELPEENKIYSHNKK